MDRRRFVTAVALAPIAISIPSIALAEDDLTSAAPRRGGPTAGPAGAGPSGAVVAPPSTPTPVTPARVAPTPTIASRLELAGGFQVVRTHGVHFGALPFVLEGEGERFQIDVLRPGAGPSGVFATEHFALFVHDHGAASTSPARERGARALGLALERRIGEGHDLPRLVSFTERRARHASAIYAIDYDRADAPTSSSERT